MSEAFVTLATNDSYAFGAATLCCSIKRTGTTRPVVCMVTAGVSPLMRMCMERFFDRLVPVDVMDSNDTANLALLGRPELGVTFTKLSCWRLTTYTKAVFLDADTLVLSNVDDLFEREEFSAAPDLGWPDCFNSGVFVFRPSEETYNRLLEFALTNGSFDGGDQGLLNSFFSDWAHKDISRHIPYVYNTAFAAAPYSYLPALKHFFHNLKIIHFLGALKPWLFPTDEEGAPLIPPNFEFHDCSLKLISAWWNIHNTDVKSKLAEGVCLKRVQEGQGLSPSYGPSMSPEEEDRLHRAAWESGYVEYHGRDAFSQIKSHMDSVMAKTTPVAAGSSRPTSSSSSTSSASATAPPKQSKPVAPAPAPAAKAPAKPALKDPKRK